VATESSSSRLSELGGVGCLFFFALFWSGMTLAVDFFIGRSAFHQIQALGYPVASGSVTHSEVETVSGDDGPTYRPKIRYGYTVAGKEYVGDRHRYGNWSSGGGYAHRIVASLPVGARVEVHYAPGDPSDAVLTAGVEGMDLFFAMAILPFNLIMLALWTVIGGGVRYRLFPSPAGGGRVWEDGRYVRVRLALGKPLYVGAGVAGLAAFVGTFVIGFGFGSDPSLPAMLVVWAVILGGGVLAGLAYGRTLAQGQSDLILDQFRRSITLPPTLGRIQDLLIPDEKIVAIEVERTEKRSSRGVSRAYIPTIVFTDDDGSTRREGIVRWTWEARAEGLASWLRERLGIEPAASGED